MQYKSLIDNIRYLSETHQLVSSFEEGDNIFKVNYTDNCYPLVYLTPMPHSINHPTSIYKFALYYVDRLLGDKSNKIDIQSAGIKALNDIIMDIDYLYNTESLKPINLTVFTEKFTDECAGVWVELSIETVNDANECNSLNGATIFIETEDDVLLVTEDNKEIILE